MTLNFMAIAISWMAGIIFFCPIFLLLIMQPLLTKIFSLHDPSIAVIKYLVKTANSPNAQ
jgi:hypothetical protein